MDFTILYVNGYCHYPIHHPEQYLVVRGAKNYVLKLSDASSICKVRGFSLSYRTNLLLNFDVMSEMILSGDREVKTCDHDALIRTTSHPKVYLYEKRVALADGIHTVPFGWMTSSPSNDK